MESVERVVGVVSGKGGTGKTTFVANVGLALAGLNERITVVDGDLSTANLGLQLGLYQFPAGLQEALRGRIGIGNAMYTHPSGLRIIPASVSLKYLSMSFSPYRLRSLLSRAGGMVMIDSPPGIGYETSFVLRACDDVIVVTNPEIPAATDALKAIELSRSLGKEPVGVVINRVKGKHELRPEEVEEICGLKAISIIPEDEMVKRSLFEKVPVVLRSPLSPASLAFRRLASEMAGLEFRDPSFLGIRRLLGGMG
jgi:septum site-determining protein MinD